MSSNAKPILLDGSMGQEIVNRGGKSAYGEWAVAALHENPQLVKDIHTDYIRAGADVITTNTYSSTRTRLRHVNLEDRFKELVNIAGQLAVDARNNCDADHVKIAASLPPLEASYINEFTLSFDAMVNEYRELMDLLDPYVDVYLGETFSTIQESSAFLTAATNRAKPVWISWTLKDHGSTVLRGKESLTQALDSLKQFSLDAVLVNCTTPDSINAALPMLKSTGKPFGAYANGFSEIPDTWEEAGDVNQIMTQKDFSPDVYSQHVKSWIEKGAAIVGGCCDVGPDHIAHARKTIDSIA